MAFNFGNILNGVGGFIEDTANQGLNQIKNGAVKIGNQLKSEVLASLTGQSPDPIYDSTYPLGNEWIPDPAYTVTFAYTDPNTKQVMGLSGYMPDTISMGLTADYNSPLESIGEGLSSGTVGLAARLFGYKVSANMFSMVLWSGSSHMDLELELRFVALTDTKSEVLDKIRALYSLITPTIDSFSATEGPVQLGLVTSPGPSLELAPGTDAESLLNDVLNGGSMAIGGIAGSVVGNVGGLIDGSISGTQATVGTVAGSAQAVGAGINQIIKAFRVKNNISLKLGEFAIMKSVVIKAVTPVYNVKCDLDGNMIEASVSVSVGTFVSPTNLDIPSLVGYKAGADVSAFGSNSASTSVNPLQTIATPPYFGTGSNIGLVFGNTTSSGATITPTGIFNKIKSTVTTAVTPLKTAVLGNQSTLGMDSGLGYKYMDTIYSGSKPNLPGLSSSDRTDFTKLFNV